jgi:hypothetical protein
MILGGLPQLFTRIGRTGSSGASPQTTRSIPNNAGRLWPVIPDREKRNVELRTHGLALTLDFSPPNDEDRMACNVAVEVPGFSGEFRCWVWRPDLQSFHRQLVQMIEQVGVASSAKLTSTDPGIDLRFSLNRAGRIEGRYALQNFDTPGQPTLSGDFQMDQSYLPGLLAQVAELLEPETT